MAERKFKHISVARDGAVWALDKTDGTVCRLWWGLGGIHWIPDKAGKGEVIAAVDGLNAYCVNKVGEIWRVETKDMMDTAGKWTKHPTHSGKADAGTIAVGADGASWYAQTDGTMFRAPQPGDGVGLGFWLGPFANAKADVIAIHNQDDVWRIDKKGEIWRYDNHTWTKVPTHSGRGDAKTISAAADGSCWYAQTDGKLFRRENNTWKQDPTANVDVIAVYNKDDGWGVNGKGEVWHYFGGQWGKIVEDSEQTWQYTVTAQDKKGLGQIVRTHYHVQDAATINRIIDKIVALSHLPNRDRINVGQTLTMPPLNYRG